MPENKCYIPASPCNHIIYFIKSGEKEHLRNYIKFLEQYDHIPHFHTDEPPRKKPQLTGWVKRVKQSEAEISQSRVGRNDTEVEY